MAPRAPVPPVRLARPPARGRRARRAPEGAHARWRRTGVLPGAPVPRLAELIAAQVRRAPGPPPGEAAAEAVWLQRCIAAAALGCAVTLAPLDDAQAASAQLGVRVTVPLVAAMQMHFQVPTLVVRDEDVARGYVDVVAGSRFSVATTSRDGYQIDLVPRSTLFRSVEVVLGAARAEIGPDGGTLVARGRPRRDADAALHYRFRLAAGVVPGTYPFPLDLLVRPL